MFDHLSSLARFVSCRSLLMILVALVAFAASPLLAEDWPAWRGAAGDGVVADAKLPLKWSDTENVLWHIELPDRGNSTPIVIDGLVILTQAVDATKQRSTMAFQADNGELVWKKGVTYSEDETSHRDNPYCAASPVSDGDRVFSWYGSAGLYCYDMKGKELWRRDLGKQKHMWGNAASPVLYKDLCILSFGPGEREFLLAVDKKTGKTVWQIEGLNTPVDERRRP